MTGRAAIDRLIVNGPWGEPARHWRYDRAAQAFALAEGRRPAGYTVASGATRSFDDPGRFIEMPLVNRIRPRVRAWREAGWPGVTGVTRRLLEHWNDEEEFEARRFFFCQLEAAETLIWLAEAPEAERTGVDIPSDGGPFPRLCAKMATGTGKTVVMAMVLAWHILNKTAYPRDPRFAKHALVVAPGLTVKNRLAVLSPSHPEHYYGAFRIAPPALFDKLRQGRVLVRNRHALGWDSAERVAARRGVDKRGARSDEAWLRGALGDMARARNLLIVNDEAHHAWRVPPGGRIGGVKKTEIESATRWVGALDRIQRARGVLACYDFSATPFAPTGGRGAEHGLFGWIVSDFGLNDAIEAGLVKTPRVAVRDDTVPDAKSYRSRLYHIYADPEVRDDLNRKAAPEEPLPDLVTNGYLLLGADWRETARKWREAGAETPPALITVANRTETAARVKYAFDNRRIAIDELCDPERTLHIDSKVLEAAEAAEDGGDGAAGGRAGRNARERAERLRRQVDTVGKPGQPGAQIRKVISVGMLTEGWDARNVTHIMGLRAFASQLLCEQVVGRGLRRTSWETDPETGFFDPEYVNVFGVPFTFLPHEGGAGGAPPPPAPKVAVRPDPAKAEYAISWPNVVRIERRLRPRLSLDGSALEPLTLDAAQSPTLAELAPTVDGRPDPESIAAVDLEALARTMRVQRLAFEAARDILAQERRGGVALFAQLAGILEAYIRSDALRVTPEAFARDGLKRRLVVALNMARVAGHIGGAIRSENTETPEPVFDADRPIGETGDMRAWLTSRPCARTARSHINVCVFDGTWEASDAFVLDRAPEVAAWAKNDHLGFEVLYAHRGAARKYRPDFLVRLRSGAMLVLETKGRDREIDRDKRRYLAEWTEAVNAHGGFGRWRWAVAFKPGDIHDILAQHSAAPAGGA